MPNFYKENDDIRFHMKHMDLDREIELKENYFADKGKFDYAPVNTNDARDSYDKVLDVIGGIAGDFIAPRAPKVDEEGAHFENGEVQYAKGTEEALDVLKKADMMGFTLPRKYGGLNCPVTIYAIATEMVSRADAALMNLFGLQDIADTINLFGDEDQRMRYLPRFCSGEVTGSMALTEPDAGSDLQAVMLKAYEDEKGQWRLKGVKRFITNGCGQISLVLARSEEGTTDGRGLSMFIYERDKNMKIRRIENKLGIHGSPTCELQFNDARAELCGKRRMGLIKYVMSLMNGARLAIAAQGLGIAEAAYAEADQYAKDRVQFKKAIRDMIPVSEILVNMRVKIEAGRTLLYETARIVDIKNGLEEQSGHSDEKAKELRDEMKKYTALAALFTPMAKFYNTELANQAAYDNIQIHGGTGFMKEFNAERHYRDARITNIYEGTTQLQVVAAIGGIVKGVAMDRLNTYDKKFDFSGLEYLRKPVREIKDLTEKAIAYVRDKNDPLYQDYHSRRLVEMVMSTTIAYLMLRDASHSERKKDVLKYFLEFSLPEVKARCEMILNNTAHLLEKKQEILDGKN